MSQYQQLAEEFQQRGFANGGQVIDEKTCEILNKEVLRVIAERDREDIPQPVLTRNLNGSGDNGSESDEDGSASHKPIWQILNIWQASKPFHDLLFHSGIAEMAATCLGAKSLRIWHDQIQYKQAEVGGELGWHQDAPYWPNITPNDAQITAWVALDDVDIDNGCMSMVPGSHRWGNAADTIHTAPHFCALPATYQGHEVAVVRRPVQAGHVHFHHSLTWHGSHANTSGRPRRAIAFHFMNEDTVRSNEGHHPMEQFMTAQVGEVITDPAFPCVWQDGQAVTMDA